MVPSIQGLEKVMLSLKAALFFLSIRVKITMGLLQNLNSKAKYYGRDRLACQVAEGVLIKMRTGKILNSKQAFPYGLFLKVVTIDHWGNFLDGHDHWADHWGKFMDGRDHWANHWGENLP